MHTYKLNNTSLACYSDHETWNRIDVLKCIPILCMAKCLLLYILTNITLSIKNLTPLSWRNWRTRLSRDICTQKSESAKERETLFLTEYWREWDGDPCFYHFFLLFRMFLCFSFATARGSTHWKNIQQVTCSYLHVVFILGSGGMNLVQEAGSNKVIFRDISK